MTITLAPPTLGPPVHLLECELTARCQLKCDHCLTDSSPLAGHGVMTGEDWQSVITQAAELHIPAVQLIGGEPTQSPHFARLLNFALHRGLRIEVFSNLYHITEYTWPLLRQDGVTLATSWYSDQAAQHDEITNRPGSHHRTRANIQQALRFGIPLRVGIVQLHKDQRVTQARALLIRWGVDPARIVSDRARGIGRATNLSLPTNIGELCGSCGRGRAAILPDGTLAPCVLGRILPVGNVRDTPLADLFCSPAWKETVDSIPTKSQGGCVPDDGNDCSPASTDACSPAFK